MTANRTETDHKKSTINHVTVPFSLAHLSLAIDAHNAVRRLMHRGDKNGVAADSVHVDASARLQVVEMDVAKLGDEVDDTIFLADLPLQQMG